MEKDNQNSTKSNESLDEIDLPSEAEHRRIENSEIENTNPEARSKTNNNDVDQEAGSSGAVNIRAEKTIQKRNYRRRIDDSDQDSDDESLSEIPELSSSVNLAVHQDVNETDALVVENFNVPPSDSEEVSLEDLRVSGSEDDNNQNERSSSNSTTDSDSSFSFGSPLSPLLRFGLGDRRIIGDDDTDSNASSDEEIVDKAKRKTREIINKDAPLHNSLTWPRILFNRESGYYCRRNESRFANHHKVFERNFYGSLNAVERLELMAKLNEHFGCVNCLSFSKNGLFLLSGSDDLRIILWSWYNSKALTTANTKHRKNIFQCKFYEETNSNMKVISASADGSISLHNFRNDGGHTEKQVYTHQGAVHKIAVTDNVVYTCGEDGLIMEFDFRSKTPSKLTVVREKHRKIPLFSISAHPQEMKYAVSGRDQFVRVYDRRSHKTIYSRHCPTELLEKNTTIRYISTVVYNYNGTELLASFNDENIYLFDSSNQSLGSYLHQYQGHVNSATIKGVNFFGLKSEFIVSGSDCSNIFFWDKKSEAIVQWMAADENGIVNVLEPHPIYPILASSGLDKDVKIWMPSNEDFNLKREKLENCVLENIKNQIQAGQSATFSLDPAIIQLARRFFQRSRQDSASPNPTAYIYQSSDEDS